ncbi:MAG: hypothetical protein BGN86_13510 [Caulobacterales bacterium 68-7]|nr:MAG: hypothetical protein BGN86_13510 [Caulobacterales bacterium 68-7]
MSGEIDPALERKLLIVLDYGERLVLVLLFAGLVVRMVPSLDTHPINALALIADGLVVAFVLVRRRTDNVTTHAGDWMIALAASLLPLLIKPGGSEIAPQVVAGALMFVGLLITLWAKLSLRRSFGIAAANRGVVETGPYRLVRHPMYAGYVVVHIGFMLANPLLWNLAILVAAFMCQIVRIFAEERLLSQDPVYAAMMQRVKFRLLPGVF